MISSVSLINTGLFRTSLVVQWLRVSASTAGVVGLIPGWGSSACHVVWPKKKKKKIRAIHIFCLFYLVLVFVSCVHQ